MLHQLSVTSDTDSVISCLKHSDKVKTDIRKGCIIFSSENEKEMDAFKQNLADAITSVIQTKYRLEIISHILNYDHSFLTPHDKDEIFSSLYNKSDRCSEMVFSELSEYLSTSDTISVEGFVNFRLPKYKEELRREVDRSVRLFLADREYNEFIDLLAYFVSCQPSKEPLLHIVVTPNSGFSIYNSDICEITSECAKLIADTFYGDEISFDDILLGALITIVPMKIVFHNAAFIKTPNLLETIDHIFKGKVVFCNGCPLCTQKK